MRPYADLPATVRHGVALCFAVVLVYLFIFGDWPASANFALGGVIAWAFARLFL